MAQDLRPRGRRNKGARPVPVAPKNNPGDATPVVTWTKSDAGDADFVDGQTALAIARLLREHRDKPFFIAAGFHKPHLPWIAPRKYFDLYPGPSVALPTEPADVRKGIPPLALITTRPDGAIWPSPTNATRLPPTRPARASSTRKSAWCCAVDELGLWDDTVVVLWGDHGWHLGDHGGLWGKLTVFEQAARVPLIVAAPGAAAGGVSPRLVELIDLYPSLVELCGVPAPDGLEGTSFVPLLRSPGRPWKKAAFTQVLREAADVRGKARAAGGPPVMGRSVRTRRWRYTEWGGPEVAELYDHDRDPRELQNLASVPEHRQSIAELRRILAAGWREAGPGASRLKD